VIGAPARPGAAGSGPRGSVTGSVGMAETLTPRVPTSAARVRTLSRLSPWLIFWFGLTVR